MEEFAKAVAWLLRYKKWLVMKAKDKEECLEELKKNRQISVEEVQNPEFFIISCIQEECFEDELSMMRSGQSVKRSSPLCKLDPVIYDGVIHVGGRLSNAPDGYDIDNHLPILPKQHHVSDLIIRY